MPSMEDAGEIKSPVLIFFSSVKIVKIIVRALTEPGDYKFNFFSLFQFVSALEFASRILQLLRKNVTAKMAELEDTAKNLPNLGQWSFRMV